MMCKISNYFQRRHTPMHIKLTVVLSIKYNTAFERNSLTVPATNFSEFCALSASSTILAKHETENNGTDQHEELLLLRTDTAAVASPTANSDITGELKTFDDHDIGNSESRQWLRTEPLCTESVQSRSRILMSSLHQICLFLSLFARKRPRPFFIHITTKNHLLHR